MNRVSIAAVTERLRGVTDSIVSVGAVLPPGAAMNELNTLETFVHRSNISFFVSVYVPACN